MYQVAHIIHRLDIGGLENGLVNLINNMPVGRYRHVVVCLTGYTEFRRRLRREHAQVFALNKREGKDLTVQLRLWRLLRRIRPDIVHSRNLATLDCTVTAWMAGVRHRIHGEHGWDVHDQYGRSTKYRLFRIACRPFVERYVTVSQDLAAWLQDRVGVPPAKTTQIYNGVDTERFRPATGEKQALPWPGFAPPGTVVIGSVGRMQTVKDPLTLARAFVLMLDTVPGTRERVRLVMVGDGPLRVEAQRILAEAGAEDLAWLPGARDDVPELLRALDLFALPSLKEGISNTILEAMSTGLPVVATNVGGNPELVRQGTTGLLVPPDEPAAMAEALSAYAENEELRRLHGRNSRETAVRDFSLGTMVNRYSELYDSVLGYSPPTHETS